MSACNVHLVPVLLLTKDLLPLLQLKMFLMSITKKVLILCHKRVSHLPKDLLSLRNETDGFHNAYG